MFRVATAAPAMRVECLDIGRTPLLCVDSPTLFHLVLGQRFLTEEGRLAIPEAITRLFTEGTETGRWSRNHADTWHMDGGLWRR